MTEVTLKIDGMSCNHCVMAVKNELSKIDLKNFNVEIGLVTAKFDEHKVQVRNIEKAIEDAGYKIIKNQ